MMEALEQLGHREGLDGRYPRLAYSVIKATLDGLPPVVEEGSPERFELDFLARLYSENRAHDAFLAEEAEIGALEKQFLRVQVKKKDGVTESGLDVVKRHPAYFQSQKNAEAAEIIWVK